MLIIIIVLLVLSLGRGRIDATRRLLAGDPGGDLDGALPDPAQPSHRGLHAEPSWRQDQLAGGNLLAGGPVDAFDDVGQDGPEELEPALDRCRVGDGIGGGARIEEGNHQRPGPTGHDELIEQARGDREAALDNGPIAAPSGLHAFQIGHPEQGPRLEHGCQREAAGDRATADQDQDAGKGRGERNLPRDGERQAPPDRVRQVS